MFDVALGSLKELKYLQLVKIVVTVTFLITHYPTSRVDSILTDIDQEMLHCGSVA